MRKQGVASIYSAMDEKRLKPLCMESGTSARGLRQECGDPIGGADGRHELVEVRGDPEGGFCDLDRVRKTFKLATCLGLEEQRTAPVERQLRSDG